MFKLLDFYAYTFFIVCWLVEQWDFIAVKYFKTHFYPSYRFDLDLLKAWSPHQGHSDVLKQSAVQPTYILHSLFLKLSLSLPVCFYINLFAYHCDYKLLYINCHYLISSCHYFREVAEWFLCRTSPIKLRGSKLTDTHHTFWIWHSDVTDNSKTFDYILL